MLGSNRLGHQHRASRHSPPKPNPWSAFNTSSCGNVWANPLRNVKTENQRMVICSTRTRPTDPKPHPPSTRRAQTQSASHCRSNPPAPCPGEGHEQRGNRDTEHLHVECIEGQPPKHAQKVRRSAELTSRYQWNMATMG